MKKMTASMEIAFWDFITPLLSESAFVRWIFTTIGFLVIEKKKMLIPILVFPWAVFGLLTGFVIGRSGHLPW
jgi:hypothetical protein